MSELLIQKIRNLDEDNVDLKKENTQLRERIAKLEAVLTRISFMSDIAFDLEDAKEIVKNELAALKESEVAGEPSK